MKGRRIEVLPPTSPRFGRVAHHTHWGPTVPTRSKESRGKEAAENSQVPVSDNGNATFDLYLREQTSGQQLEAATLEAVLGNKLLSYPLGVNMLDVDLTQASGVLLCSTLNKIGGHAKHRQCGSFFCKCAFPFLHLGKPKPSARIGRVCIACMGDKDVVIRHLTPEFFTPWR